MNKSSKSLNREEPDFFIDITTETCPMTFVRTKLMIESMSEGDILNVRLQGEEALENVPNSAKRMGNKVISLEPESDNNDPHGIHQLLIQKL
tara:strand:- start:226 stop:501 length:276 start_codon:yes stop_codon:yes gene_type:complete